MDDTSVPVRFPVVTGYEGKLYLSTVADKCVKPPSECQLRKSEGKA